MVVKIRSLIIPILLSVAIISCNSGANKGVNSNRVIDIEKSIGSIEVVNLSEVAKSINYIPLETNDSALISNISKIICENDKIYVSDNSDKLYIFDLNGKYLNTLNRKGRGPGEYINLRNFKVDEKSGNILILDYTGDISIYGTNLNFIRKIKSPVKDVNFTSFEIFGDSLFAASNFILADNTPCNMIFFKDSSKLINSFKFRPIDFIANGNDVPLRLNHPVISKFIDEMRFFSPKSDTIFSLNPEGQAGIAYIINQGKYKEPERVTFEDVISQNSPFISISPFLVETDNNIFLTLTLRSKAIEPVTIDSRTYTIANGLFSKSNGKFTILAQAVKGKTGLKDDLKNGPPFWPEVSNSQQDLIACKNASMIITYANEQTEAGGYIKELAAKLNENSNPVVIIAKTK
ncbi:MAG: 6-bladed beta-propeller [Bacteroidales bacterium]